MGEKILFFQRDIPTTQVPSVSRNHTESVIASSSRSSVGSGKFVQLPFNILEYISKSFLKFKATGLSLLI
jgi:hypothetical protein